MWLMFIFGGVSVYFFPLIGMICVGAGAIAAVFCTVYFCTAFGLMAVLSPLFPESLVIWYGLPVMLFSMGLACYATWRFCVLANKMLKAWLDK